MLGLQFCQLFHCTQKQKQKNKNKTNYQIPRLLLGSKENDSVGEGGRRSQVDISAHIGWGQEVGKHCSSYFQQYRDKLTSPLKKRLLLLFKILNSEKKTQR
jgi:hypothetical protein